jgi:hypothetical protein
VHAVAQLVEALCYKLESREFFIDNPIGSIMALELTQPLTEMSARNNSRGKKAAGI